MCKIPLTFQLDPDGNAANASLEHLEQEKSGPDTNPSFDAALLGPKSLSGTTPVGMAWMTPAARRLALTKMEATKLPGEPNNEQTAMPTPVGSEKRSLSQVMADISMRPPAPPRDLSREMELLPAMDRVSRTIEALVPLNLVQHLSAGNFLDARSRIVGSTSCFRKSSVQHAHDTGIVAAGTVPQHIIDAKNVKKKTDLYSLYRPTHSCWKNRCADKDAVIHPAFRDFRAFLIALGPRPSIEYTLDRIDNDDPEYAFDKVRWADKKGQANNRRNTIWLTARGERKPLSTWAEETGQISGTLRARLRKGLTAEEVIFGENSSSQLASKTSCDQRPWKYHDDVGFRQRAEEFYLRQRHSAEEPFPFCIRLIKAGTEPWASFLSDNFCNSTGEDYFGSVVAHNIAQLEQAEATLLKLAAIRGLLEDTWALLKPAPSNQKSRKRRTSSHAKPSRRREDPEVEYNNFCESYPWLEHGEEP